MNADLFERLTPLLATYLIHSTCFIGAVGLVVRFAGPRSARFRQIAWKLGMLLGAITAPLQSTLAIVPYSGQVALPLPAAHAAADAPSAVDAAIEDLVEIDKAQSWDGLPRPSAPEDGQGRPSHEAASKSPSVDRSLGERVPGLQTPARPASGLLTAIGVAWMAGVSFFALRVAIGWLRLGGPSGLVELCRGPERRALDELCRQAGVTRRVRLYRARNGASPIAWGLLRWHVALPDLLTKRLNRRELRALLAHELGHLVHGDTRWLWLASVIGSLGFIQPLNKLAQRRICREAELLSDRWAVARTGDRLALARSLTAVAELLLGPTAALAAGAASTRSALRERLEILLDDRPLAPPGSHRGARSLAAVVAVVVALGGVSLLPAARLPKAAVVDSASAALASSNDLEEAVGGLWQEFDLLGVELGQLQRVLASAEQGEASEAAERIRRRSLTLGERRNELRGRLESLGLEE